MKADSEKIRLSATDLANHLACNHSTSLDLAAALGTRSMPVWHSPDLHVMRERGFAHENAYLEQLTAQGLEIVRIRDIADDEQAAAATCAAMEQGVDAIAQATLASGQWFGRADVLRRVELASKLGSWSYEVYDCKLARETKAGTILQLSLYSELVASIQEVLPESMYVIPPGVDFRPEQYRVLDFAAYYRYLKARLENAVEQQLTTRAEPTAHCDICHWWPECDSEWRRQDHLSLVAGISRLHRKQLSAWEVNTVEQLAALPLPINFRPDYGSTEGYAKVREQARVQVAGRNQGRPVYEVLEITDKHGLSLLPAPSPGDIFFDLESDPFVGVGGREYLFGFVSENQQSETIYESRWAMTADEEKRAFEWFVDVVMAKWAKEPAMHIYHFTPYEPSALKRLMGRYATREEEIDRILRAGRFIDVHTVLKRAVRASVEQYSLKALEIFHGFQRQVSLQEARLALRQMEHGLELWRTTEPDEMVRKTIALYNEDGCLSTWSLRNWLERERLALEQAGRRLPRPQTSDGAPSATIEERQRRTAELAARLKEGISVDPEQRNQEEAACWLLANLLDWHRRESKAGCWEYFRLRDMTDEELFYEKSALSGLQFVECVELQKNVPTDRYSFQSQETDIRDGDKLCEGSDVMGTVVAIDIAKRTIDIKKTKKAGKRHPKSVFVYEKDPDTAVLESALVRLGTWVSINGFGGPGPYRAARDLLLRLTPRFEDGSNTFIDPNESGLKAAKRLGTSLDHSVLPIQGPPGAGKTFSGAQMICELVRRGKKVGITATSHKVIRHLLEKVIKTGQDTNLEGLSCIQKVTEKPEIELPGVTVTTDPDEPLTALNDGMPMAAGTVWLWAKEEYFEAVDVLFIDEAGQMSLANVLAASQAAKSLVLLGDPQQLEQPSRGSHPEGADVSALEHLLQGAKTVHAGRGLFLEKTWRLHPNICSFTSEVFYEGRLRSREGLENQKIEGHPWLGQSGLWFVPVHHEGNQNASAEEVNRIAELMDGLVRSNVRWIDDKGQSKPLQWEDVLIVSPYNAQVSDLGKRLQEARVGTVDKFQGQEAPVVIYSLATSSPEQAPRGMEFLYSLNRLNVATSRARNMVIVVGSPRLLEPECRSPRQMQLANALCRYVELAQVADL
ncbi:MAG: TM0106 family RecB-like putative nuclease [Verrucomicrobia bacterium]|nr:TM0106 family RecB-like putative nuclease [Verrucomicrobiota bacterium]